MPKKQTALVKGHEASLVALEKVDASCTELAGMNTGMVKMVAQAVAIQQMRTALLQPQVMDLLLSLKNTPLGFQTDETGPNPGKGKKVVLYTKEEIADCIIAGRLQGFYPINNQMNIISHKAYGTKEGFTEVVSNDPRCDNLENFWIQDLEFVKISGKAKQIAYISGKINYKLKGEDLACNSMTVPVKWDDYSSTDQAFGKAERKMLAWLYKRVTGQSVSLDDGDYDAASPSNDDAIPVEAEVVEDAPTAPTALQIKRIEQLLKNPKIAENAPDLIKKFEERTSAFTQASANLFIAGLISKVKELKGVVPDAEGVV